MVVTTVRDARLNLSRLLQLVAQGDEILIRNRKTPVARLVPATRARETGFPDLTDFRATIGQAENRRGASTEAHVRADREGRD